MRTTNRQIVNNDVVNRIIETLSLRKKTQKELIEYLGLSNGAFTRWKYNNGKSYLDYIDRIAEFLDVKPEYLLYGTDTEIPLQNMTPQEVDCITKFRKLNDNQKVIILEVIDQFELANQLTTVR